MFMSMQNVLRFVCVHCAVNVVLPQLFGGPKMVKKRKKAELPEAWPQISFKGKCFTILRRRNLGLNSDMHRQRRKELGLRWPAL